MNLRNLAMWAVIIVLTIGLYNMFKNPQRSISQNNSIIFSEFLNEVDNGRVVQVDIQGNNIKGILSNGENFTTYSPNDPNLIQRLTEKGVSISAAPLDEKMPSLFGVLLSWFPMLLLIAVWIFFMRQMQGGKGGAMGFGRSKAKMMNEVKGKVTFNDVAGVEEDIIRERFNNPNWIYDSFWNLQEDPELSDLEEKWMRKLYETLYEDLNEEHSAVVHYEF